MIFRLFSTLSFIALVVFTIPLAFDVGGPVCGLAFSLSIAVYYLVHDLARFLTPETSVIRKALFRLAQASQWLVVFSILIWSLNKFSTDTDSDSAGPGDWLSHPSALARPLKDDPTLYERFLGRGGALETTSISAWYYTLRYSAPMFQILEGFCSLLVAQMCGDLAKQIVNESYGGDIMTIFLLAVSASIFSSASYFFYRVANFPTNDHTDSLLIGSVITCAVSISIWSIGSGRGNPIEASLIFAYISLCVYQIFTDYHSTDGSVPSQQMQQPALPPLPPVLMASYSTLLTMLSSLPSTVLSTFDFVQAAFSTITPSVLISLLYRVLVMYVACIIPVVRSLGIERARSYGEEEYGRVATMLGRAFTTFSPTILIGVYTSLLLQHFANGSIETQQAHAPITIGSTVSNNIWSWINVGFTFVLYAVEVSISGENRSHK